jgi:hypothetical protein
MTRESLQRFAIKLRDIIKEKSIKIINMAKSKEFDGIQWEEVLSHIRESIVGTSTKLIICHGQIINFISNNSRSRET